MEQQIKSRMDGEVDEGGSGWRGRRKQRVEEGGCGRCVANKPRETDGHTHGENRNGDVIRNKSQTVATTNESQNKSKPRETEEEEKEEEKQEKIKKVIIQRRKEEKTLMAFLHPDVSAL